MTGLAEGDDVTIVRTAQAQRWDYSIVCSRTIGCRAEDGSDGSDEKQLVWQSPSGLLGSGAVQLSFVCMCSEREQGIIIVGSALLFLSHQTTMSLD